MDSSESQFDPARCPLCGGINACVMELERISGVAQPTCWCTRVRFAPELLSRIPPAKRAFACICPSCVDKADGEADLD